MAAVKEIVGLYHRMYPKKDTGEVVDCWDIYFQFEDPDIEGYGTENIFLRARDLAGYEPQIGDRVVISRNRWNRPDGLIKVG